jgi:hypothetical protein
MLGMVPFTSFRVTWGAYTVDRVRSIVPRAPSAAWAAASRAIGTRNGEQLT